MTQINIGGNELLLVEVPESAKDIFIDEDGDLCYIGNFHGFKDIRMLTKLPSSGWLLLGRGSEISEDQWKGIVEDGYFPNLKVAYRDYDQVQFGFTTATESGLSLIKSKGYEPGKVVVLIKK